MAERERERERGSGLEGRSMFPGIIGQPGLRTRYEMQARPSRVGLEFLGLLLMWMRYPERRSELGRSIESSHAWRGLQMSEDPKRRSEANARKTAFAGERLKEVTDAAPRDGPAPLANAEGTLPIEGKSRSVSVATFLVATTIVAHSCHS